MLSFRSFMAIWGPKIAHGVGSFKLASEQSPQVFSSDQVKKQASILKYHQQF